MIMPQARASLMAVLGPTNTGKTHLAVERMCGHSSGMMGFPLRLLAREVYDRVVRIKGANKVALITGEEKIEPPGARYYCCTVNRCQWNDPMPLSRLTRRNWPLIQNAGIFLPTGYCMRAVLPKR